MKLLTLLATCAILLSGCGGTTQTNPTPGPTAVSETTLTPIPDDIGLVLQCGQCAFVEEKGLRYIGGQIHSDAKQALTGYVLAVDLQDAKGSSIKKLPGLMLMNAMAIQPGETKEFKERVVSSEPNVAQAVVYFKKSGTEVKLSPPVTLKLNARR
jgi:hypothetical protein